MFGEKPVMTRIRGLAARFAWAAAGKLEILPSGILSPDLVTVPFDSG